MRIDKIPAVLLLATTLSATGCYVKHISQLPNTEPETEIAKGEDNAVNDSTSKKETPNGKHTKDTPKPKPVKPKPVEPKPVEPKPVPPKPPVAQDPADAINRLSELGAAITLDEDGRVAAAQFVQPIENADLEVLTQLVAITTVSLRGQTQIDDAAMPTIAKLSTVKVLDLGVCVQITSKGIEAIRLMPELQDINLERTAFDNDAIGFLRETPKLKRIRLARTSLGDSAMTSLKDETQLELLDMAHVSGNEGVTDVGLLQLSGLTKMRSLRIWGSQITDEGLKAVKDMKDLRVLSVEDAYVVGPGLEYIGGLSKLTELKFFQTYLTPDSLKHLSELKALKKLGLRLNVGVNDESMKALEGLTELTEIDLSETSVTGIGMESLAKLPKLERLTLWRTKVDDAGVEHLGKINSLKRLSLQKTGITDAGLAHLKGLDNLTWLNIGENEMTDAGLVHLGDIASLKELIVMNCPSVTQEGIDKLTDAIPGLRVEK